jgi:hypothetical protein
MELEDPVQQYSCLICGLIMIVLAVVVVLKIYKRSNNEFAYILLSYTVLLGVAYIGLALTEFISARKH